MREAEWQLGLFWVSQLFAATEFAHKLTTSTRTVLREPHLYSLSYLLGISNNKPHLFLFFLYITTMSVAAPPA